MRKKNTVCGIRARSLRIPLEAVWNRRDVKALMADVPLPFDAAVEDWSEWSTQNRVDHLSFVHLEPNHMTEYWAFVCRKYNNPYKASDYLSAVSWIISAGDELYKNGFTAKCEKQ